MEKITQKKKYFVVRERAVPEVLLKVVQAKKLLDSEKVSTVQEAAEQIASLRFWSAVLIASFTSRVASASALPIWASAVFLRLL